MDDRQPSPHEMRARMGFAGSIVIGLGVAAALGTATNSMPIGLGVGLAVTVVLMVVFTRAGSRKRRPSAAGSTGPDAADTDREHRPDDDADTPA
ncbi:MAG TPA: hypothetical protein VN041_01390 [Microbacterium sp.]|nr:hypothetical protein [Microbacterium sp.]